jgi:hypothetical protein
VKTAPPIIHKHGKKRKSSFMGMSLKSATINFFPNLTCPVPLVFSGIYSGLSTAIFLLEY